MADKLKADVIPAAGKSVECYRAVPIAQWGRKALGGEPIETVEFVVAYGRFLIPDVTGKHDQHITVANPQSPARVEGFALVAKIDTNQVTDQIWREVHTDFLGQLS